jgi:copper/silver efflux system protein
MMDNMMPGMMWGMGFVWLLVVIVLILAAAALMTVVAIMAGLLPIMWSTGTGSEIMQRIAVPMIGGMISSTLLTLIVIPAIYALVKGSELGKVSVTKAEPGQAGASVV